MYCDSKKAARAHLAERIREVSNRPPEAGELTFRGFVEGVWRPHLDLKGVKPSTRRSYESGLENHILPAFGDLLVAQVCPLHIEELLRAKLKAGMSPKTLRNLVALLSGIFSLAVDNDLIERSPVRDKHRPAVERREKPAWTPEQVRAILAAVPESSRVLLTTAAMTGARLGELLALQWKQIDLANQTLRIEQSLWNARVVSPKTPGSVRTIPFGPVLAQALRRHRDASGRRGSEDFAFAKPNGTPLNPDVLRRDVLYPVLDRLGIPRSQRNSGFHRFRHSAGSFVNAQTGNLKLAQKLLGHSNFNTTADIYTHTSLDQERAAAAAVEKAIFGNLFPIVPEIRNNSPVPGVN